MTNHLQAYKGLAGSELFRKASQLSREQRCTGETQTGELARHAASIGVTKNSMQRDDWVKLADLKIVISSFPKLKEN